MTSHNTVTLSQVKAEAILAKIAPTVISKMLPILRTQMILDKTHYAPFMRVQRLRHRLRAVRILNGERCALTAEMLRAYERRNNIKTGTTDDRTGDLIRVFGAKKHHRKWRIQKKLFRKFGFWELNTPEGRWHRRQIDDQEIDSYRKHRTLANSVHKSLDTLEEKS